MPLLIHYLHADHEKVTEGAELEALKEKVINRVTEFLEKCDVSSDTKICLTLGNEASDQSHQIIEILIEHFHERARVITEYDLRWKTLYDVMEERKLGVNIKIRQTIKGFDEMYWYDEFETCVLDMNYTT